MRLGGVPCWATKHVRGVPKRGCRPHAGCATGTLGGAPCGATTRLRGVPKLMAMVVMMTATLMTMM
eukprot:461073-Pyramimonas_sp.AAC.1